MKECELCGVEFHPKRADAKFCSPKCRKEASRVNSLVTDNVTLSDSNVTDNLEFKFKIKNKIRTAKYWYEVPLGAEPILEEDFPEMPEYMNGRQYFLWWKNDFVIDNGSPVIISPFPTRENVTYAQGGAASRMWGA